MNTKNFNSNSHADFKPATRIGARSARHHHVKPLNNTLFRVLLIEDSAHDAHLAQRALQEGLMPSFVLSHVARLDDGLKFTSKRAEAKIEIGSVSGESARSKFS